MSINRARLRFLNVEGRSIPSLNRAPATSRTVHRFMPNREDTQWPPVQREAPPSNLGIMALQASARPSNQTPVSSTLVRIWQDHQTTETGRTFISRHPNPSRLPAVAPLRRTSSTRTSQGGRPAIRLNSRIAETLLLQLHFPSFKHCQFTYCTWVRFLLQVQHLFEERTCSESPPRLPCHPALAVHDRHEPVLLRLQMLNDLQ